MSDVFAPLSTERDLDLVLAASHAEPVIVFKHSESCGSSWMAESSLAGHAWPVKIHKLIVQRSRAVSDRLARLLGVRHESPQVLILVDGRVAWHTSHAGVTHERVAAQWTTLRQAHFTA